MADNKGSPPRMRGKGDMARKQGREIRITPAYAGKRTSECPHTIEFEDHPRVCGEKSACMISRVSCGGSPPRMRGKD